VMYFEPQTCHAVAADLASASVIQRHRRQPVSSFITCRVLVGRCLDPPATTPPAAACFIVHHMPPIRRQGFRPACHNTTGGRLFHRSTYETEHRQNNM